MGRPALGYRNAAGMKVLGVTSVLKYVSTMDTDILCNWAARLAREGKDWKQVRRAAGQSGTYLHELCENRLPHELTAGDKPPGMEDGAWGNLKLSYGAIRDWYLKHEPKLVIAEQFLISEQYQFGGTMDAVWQFPRDISEYYVKAGEAWLGDYKTGRIIGAKEVAQMSAYRQLLSENKIADVKGALLIHAPTAQPGYMRPVAINDDLLDLGWEVFLSALKVGSVLPALTEVFE